MRSRNTIYSLLTSISIITLLLSSSINVEAQDTPDTVDVSQIEVDLPNLNEDCARIERLLDIGIMPDELIQGGGEFIPNTVIENTITSLDAGDRWVFAVSDREEAIIDFTTDIDLLLQVYKGVNRIDRARIRAGSQTYRFDAPEPGIYTILVSRFDLTDTIVEGTYSIQFSGDVARVLDSGETLAGSIGVSNRFDEFVMFFRLPNGVNSQDVSIQINSEQGARFRLYADGELVENESEDITAGGRTVTFTVSKTGYYFFAIAPIDRDTDASYSVTLNTVKYEGTRQGGTGGLWQPRWETTSGIVPLVLNDKGYVDLDFNGNTVSFAADVADALVPSSSVRIEFLKFGDSEAQISFVNTDLKRLSLLDGNLNVVSSEDTTYYIEDYPGYATYNDLTGFRSIKLPDNRSVAGTNRHAIKSVWILPTCIGFGMSENRRLILESTEVNLNLTATDGNEAHPLIQQIIEGVNETNDYNFRMDWTNIRTIIASTGIVTMRFTDDRILQFDRSNITVDYGENNIFTIIENRENESGALEPNPFIATDWDNLLRILVNGEEVVMDVLDIRGRIVRQANRLRQFDSFEGVMRLQFDTNNELLLLDEAHDFLQIETPREPAAFNLHARPGEPGYLPNHFNNTGQECYPLNTSFDFNCTQNRLVNPVNGNLSFSVTDLFAAGYRIDLKLTRTYNSQNFEVDGPFGYGWDSDYWLDYDAVFNADPTQTRVRTVSRRSDYQIGLRLIEAPRGQVIFKTPTGTRYVFQLVVNGTDQRWVSEQAPGWLIEPRENMLTSPWRVVRADGLVYEFDLAGRLRRVEHPFGGSLTVERTSQNPVIYVITDDVGRKIELQYDENYHIVRSTLFDADDNEIGTNRYSYDTNKLVRVDFADGKVSTYEYNRENQLNIQHDPHSLIGSDLLFDYDPQLRIRYVATADDEDNRYTFYRYEENPELGTLTTRVVDQYQQMTTWIYDFSTSVDTAFRLLTKIDPDGTESVYEHRDTNPNLITNIARQGINYALNYDEGINLSSLVHPQAWIGFDSSYQGMLVGDNLINRLLRYRDNDINSKLSGGYSYDESGQVIQLDDSDESTLNTSIKVLERHPQFGIPTVLEYTYPTLVALTGNPDVDPKIETETITISYDRYGYPSEIKRDRNTVHFTWDAIGQLIHYSLESNGDVLLAYDVTYTFLSQGEIVTITDLLDSVTSISYDDRQRLIRREVIDSKGQRLESLQYGYDEFDRLISERQAISDDISDDLVTTYSYITEGLVEATVWRRITSYPDNTKTVIDFDASNRITQTIDKLGLVTSYTYTPNADGTLITKTDPNGLQTTTFRSLSGQFCRLNYGDIEWLAVYGGNSCNSPQREVSRVVINQRLAVEYKDYYEDGRPSEISLVANVPDVKDPSIFTPRTGARENPILQYEYDNHGRLVRVWNVEAGDQIIYTYTMAEGNLAVTETRNNLIVIPGTSQKNEIPYYSLTSTYDALDRLLSVQDEKGRITYTYTYLAEQARIEIRAFAEETELEWVAYLDSLGRLHEFIAPDKTEFVYTYDQAGRLLEVMSDGVLKTQYSYDRENRVTSILDETGRLQQFRYNLVGQLVAKVDVDGIETRYSYDELGQLIASSDAFGNSTLYQYDLRNQVKQVIYPDGQEVKFDWQENIGTLIYNNGDQITSYHFDIFDRLRQINDASGISHLFDYNASGNLSSTSQWNETYNHRYLYGAGTELLGINFVNDDTEIAQQTFNYDSAGNQVEFTDATGRVINFDYDAFTRLTDFDLMPDYQYGFEYATDGTLTYTQNEVSTGYTYDSFYRILSEQSADGQQTDYSYDGDTSTITRNYGSEPAITVIDRNPVNTADPYIKVEEHDSLTGTMQSELILRANLRGDIVEIEENFDITPADCSTADCVQIYSRNETVEYDSSGRPLTYHDRNGNQWAYHYDERGRLIEFADNADHVYRFSYDALNHLIEVSNPANEKLTISYNANAQVTAIAYNDSIVEQYSYNAKRDLVERRFPNYHDGIGRITYTYDEAGRVTAWSIDSDPPTTISYDMTAFANISSIEGDGFKLDYQYDSKNRLSKVSNGSYKEAYTYHGAGQLTQVEINGSSYAGQWSLDSQPNHLTLLIDDTPMLQWEFGDDGFIDKIITDETTFSINYGLDSQHLKTMLVDDAGNNRTLIFDASGQIISDTRVSNTGAELYLLEYDPDGKIVRGQDFQTQQTRTYNRSGLPQNFERYNASGFDLGGEQFLYDDNGRLTSRVHEDQSGKVTRIDFFYNPDDPSQLTEQRIAPAPFRVNQFASIGFILLLPLFFFRKRNNIKTLTVTMVCLVLISIIIAQDTPKDEAAIIDLQPVLQYQYDTIGRLVDIRNLNEVEGKNVTTLGYDVTGRVNIIESNDTTTRFQYNAYGHLRSIQADGDSIAYLTIGNQDIVVDTNDESHFLLDGIPDIASEFNINPLGQVLTDNHLAGQPEFEGLVYLPQHKLYISFDGRVYDPQTGNWTQRNPLGINANGSVYGVSANTKFVAQVQPDYPYLVGLKQLLAAQQTKILTADDVLAQNQIDIYGQWWNADLQHLADYNQVFQSEVEALKDLPLWLAYQANPPGVVVNTNNHFTLLDSLNPDFNTYEPSLSMTYSSRPNVLDFDLRWNPDTALQTHWIETEPPSWIDYQHWLNNSQWQPDTSNPQSLRGFPLWDEFGDYFAYPLSSPEDLSNLITWLEDGTKQNTDRIFENILSGVLPSYPELPIQDGNELLEQWFTTKLSPIQEILEGNANLPNAPAFPDLRAINLDR